MTIDQIDARPEATPSPTTGGGVEGPAVVARGVRRSFGDRVVLDGIDLEIGRDEFVALLGRSGSGKSTLLRAMAGLDPAYEGSVRVPSARSVVFQEPRLLPWRRVLPNVVLGLGRGEGVRRQGSDALARALVREPSLLLLDEPFGALDALTRLKMHGLLADLCRRHRPAVLLVTHDVDEAIALADRVLVLDDGRISVDRTVGLEHPRDRAHPAFAQLRTDLLAALGVDGSP